jgi:L,D-peptidoglycan transpeptidase YkuD (ErfK/YbiS/YcfS/YnhG family)
MKSVLVAVSLLFMAIEILLVPVQLGAAESDALAISTQLIVVTTADWNAVDGRLQRYERATPKQAWQPVGEPISIVVGKTGLAWGTGVIATDAPEVRAASDPIKKEGDSKAPAGVFALGTAFGYSPQPLPKSKLSYVHLTPSVECVDDSDSKHYNRVLDRSTVAAPDWNSSEHMLRSDELYRWGIVVGHNGIVAEDNANPPAPGGGSCIFLHIWRGPGQGTVGCTAMPQRDLESLLVWIDPARKPLLVQLPVADYERLSHRWKLPLKT